MTNKDKKKAKEVLVIILERGIDKTRIDMSLGKGFWGNASISKRLLKLLRAGYMMTDVEGEGTLADTFRKQIKIYEEDPSRYQLPIGDLFGSAARVSGIPVDQIKGKMQSIVKRFGGDSGQ